MSVKAKGNEELEERPVFSTSDGLEMRLKELEDLVGNKESVADRLKELEDIMNKLEEKIERVVLIMIQMGHGKMNRLKEYLEGIA